MLDKELGLYVETLSPVLPVFWCSFRVHFLPWSLYFATLREVKCSQAVFWILSSWQLCSIAFTSVKDEELEGISTVNACCHFLGPLKVKKGKLFSVDYSWFWWCNFRVKLSFLTIIYPLKVLLNLHGDFFSISISRLVLNSRWMGKNKLSGISFFAM